MDSAKCEVSLLKLMDSGRIFFFPTNRKCNKGRRRPAPLHYWCRKTGDSLRRKTGDSLVFYACRPPSSSKRDISGSSFGINNCLWISFVQDGQNFVSKHLTITAPTLFNASFASGSSCHQHFITQEKLKARSIVNKNYKLRPHECGGPKWTRVFFYNETDLSNVCHMHPSYFWIECVSKCLSDWSLSCGRSSANRHTCDSVLIPVNKQSYSSVCGRINAYQRGSSSAFKYSIYYSPKELNRTATIEDPYVSGLSLTYGKPGLRKHVWTFAGGRDATAGHDQSCPCSLNKVVQPNNTTTTFTPYEVPSFVGEDYFCDTAITSYCSCRPTVSFVRV